MRTKEQTPDLAAVDVYDQARRQIRTMRAVCVGHDAGQRPLITAAGSWPALADHRAAAIGWRALGLILVSWLALPLALCGWLAYGCWRLAAATGQLARRSALGPPA